MQNLTLMQITPTVTPNHSTSAQSTPTVTPNHSTSAQSTPTVTPNHSTSAQSTLATFKDYVPLFQTLVWPIFLLIIFLVFKKQTIALFQLIPKLLNNGASLEYGGVKIKTEPLVTKTANLGENVETYGNPDRFVLLFKAQGISKEGKFTKSTKAMKVPGGCVVQVTNERQNPDKSWSIAESLTFIPGEIDIINDNKKSGSLLEVINNDKKSGSFPEVINDDKKSGPFVGASYNSSRSDLT
jgi:hypothetical protein